MAQCIEKDRTRVHHPQLVSHNRNKAGRNSVYQLDHIKVSPRMCDNWKASKPVPTILLPLLDFEPFPLSLPVSSCHMVTVSGQTPTVAGDARAPIPPRISVALVPATQGQGGQTPSTSAKDFRWKQIRALPNRPLCPRCTRNPLFRNTATGNDWTHCAREALRPPRLLRRAGDQRGIGWSARQRLQRPSRRADGAWRRSIA
jgi:hypothetical protein